jgi:hypothetical protein
VPEAPARALLNGAPLAADQMAYNATTKFAQFISLAISMTNPWVWFLWCDRILDRSLIMSYFTVVMICMLSTLNFDD